MKFKDAIVRRPAVLAAFLVLISASFVLRQKLAIGTGDPAFIVKTDAGLVSGTLNKEGDIHLFRGIPFAAPPVGPLRWKAPQPVRPWEGVRPCDSFKASPMQGAPVPFSMYSAEFLIPWKPIGEDCLYLNVWTKMRTGAEKMPVIVWIYGGAFISGSGSCAIYDGENMAKKGAVFVTFNYRLGVFGFLAHPELTRESPDHSSGNYAFLDQIAALKWVRANIAAFGGDPQRVTIAGQSAGAFSVNALMASPAAKGLFHRVIAESGGMFGAETGGVSLADAEHNGERLVQDLHLSSIEEMRRMPADSLFKKSNSFRTSPVIDGYVLPGRAYPIFDRDLQNDVPVLTGWNGDDGFFFPTVTSPEEYKRNAEKKYGPWAARFLDAFPGRTLEEIKRSQAALPRDVIFAWQNYTWARLEATKGKHRSWLYNFNRVPPGDERYGAFHSAEITYALHSLPSRNKPWTEGDRQLEETMSSYWCHFAANGDPNGDGLPEWTSFAPGDRRIMSFDVPDVSMRPLAVQKQLDFLDAYQGSLRQAP